MADGAGGCCLGKELLSGNEAIARGAWEAGVSLARAYPGTPSTEILETLVGYEGVDAAWSPNEKVALEVAAGASYAGARCLVAMKHVGLNVAADPLFTLSYTGVRGGLVIVTADDPGAHSSQNEQDNRWYAVAAKLPLFEPSDSEEARAYTRYAFELSEEYDTPVLLRTTTRVSHGKSLVEPVEPSPRRPVTAFEPDRAKFVMIPAWARARHVIVEERQRALAEAASRSPLNRVEWSDRSLGIVASGVAYHYAREVYPHASFLKLGFPYPFPAELVARFAAGVKKVFVVEELDRFLETHARAAGIELCAKPDEFLVGEFSPDIVAAIVGGGEAASVEAAPKPPALCPGCPHRGVFYVLSKLGLIVTGDIGCYTLGTLPPLSALDTCLCMGAGVNHMHGLRKVLPREQAARVVAVIGDSTFVHSGITGVLDIVYDNADGLVIILDNGTTAMTGRQDHPATGRTLSGGQAPRLSLEELCRACGVPWVRTVDPYNIAELRKAVEEGRRTGGPAVLVARAPCLLLERRRGAAPVVDPDACVGCGACHDLGCPAIKEGDREGGRRGKSGPPVISSTLCTGCGLCVEVCRVGAIKRSAGGG